MSPGTCMHGPTFAGKTSSLKWPFLLGAVRNSEQSPARRSKTKLWMAKDDDKNLDDDSWEPDAEEMLKDLEELGDLDVDADDVLLVDADDEDVEEDVDKNDDDDDEDDDDDDDIEWEDEDEEDDDSETIEGELDEWEDVEEDESEYYMSGEYGSDDEWEDDDDGDYPLEDDPDDPNYQAQKKLVEETVARRQKLAEDRDFDATDYILNKMTPEVAEALDNHPLIQEVEKQAKDLVTISEDDVKDLDIEEEMAKETDLLMDDPYPNEGQDDILGTGVSDDDLEKLDNAFKSIRETLQEEPWDKVSYKAEITDWTKLSNETLEEMEACLEEIGGSAYNITRWLLYDLDFNVSNLILSAVKHNPDAPVLLHHWYPQLVTYGRYEHARQRNFDFTWQDVQNADISELERYYAGFGYEEIPLKAPSETGIIGLEELDEEELKMAALENWMTEVYNPEWDRKDFDDDDMQDEDNVFSEFYEEPQHPDLPTYEDVEDDLQQWKEHIGDDEEEREYRDFMGRDFEYKIEEDKEFEKEFRGHLVVACTPNDEDIEIAEKITQRMRKEFGKQVYVETRVIAHAREEDMVFEVWLESYEIDLLHSKKRASSNAKGWYGPAECDDKQINYLVKEVGFLISDDSRYSYRMEVDVPV